MAIASGAQKGARIAAGIDSKSNKNRFRIVLESTPNRPKSTQNWSRDPPGTPRAPKGGPRASQGRPGRPRGGPGGIPAGPRGRLWGRPVGSSRPLQRAPGPPRLHFEAPRRQKRASRERFVARLAPEALTKRFPGDFRAIQRRFAGRFSSASDTAGQVASQRADLESALVFPIRNAGRTLRADGEKRAEIVLQAPPERAVCRIAFACRIFLNIGPSSTPKSTRNHSGTPLGAPGRCLG